MNKFKIWINKNGTKIIVIGALVAIIYSMIKSANNYYEKQHEERVSEEDWQTEESDDIENSNFNKNVADDSELTTDIFKEVDSNSEECKGVLEIANKMIQTVYNATFLDNAESYKKDLYKMFSYNEIQSLASGEEYVTEETILTFFYSMSSIDDFALGKVYKYYDNNNVSRYAVYLRRDVSSGEKNYVYSYMLINVDYNNRAFEYDGSVEKLGYVDMDRLVGSVANNGSNAIE